MERQKRKIVISSGCSGSNDGKRRLLKVRIARAFTTTTATTGQSNGAGGKTNLSCWSLCRLVFSMEIVGRDNRNSIDNKMSSQAMKHKNHQCGPCLYFGRKNTSTIDAVATTYG
jgi:hypothetical protein